jgi:amino acid adenylation domain-containing protein
LYGFSLKNYQIIFIQIYFLMLIETIKNPVQTTVKTVEDSYQLSPIQQGMLFHSLYAQQSGVDIEQIICRLHDNLDVSAFQQAWQQVLERHPVLRTSFDWEGDREPLQCVHRQVVIPLEQQDWCSLPAKEQQEQLQAYLQVDRQHGFQLNVAPLVRLALFQIGESEYQFVWTFHHALLDGRSLLIVLKEVFAFYDACCRGEDLYLAQPRPYRDHIQWLQQQDWSTAESFWRQLLKGFTAPTPLLTDQTPKADNNSLNSGFGKQEIRLSEKTTSMLQSLAEQHQLTLNTLVQGAWALLLSRYSGEVDVVFGATRACRRSSVAGAESMVGLLINTLPVRVSVSPEMPLLPWLKDLRSQWLTLRDYEQTPLVKIQSWSEVPGGTSLFKSLLVFENYDLNSALRSQGGRWESLEVWLEEQTNYPLTLVGCTESELLLKLNYDRQCFDDARISRMLGHLQTLLESMAANPWQCLGELPLLTPAEQYQMLVEWNNTQADFPKHLCIHQLFETQVELTPDAIAVVFEEQQLTYRELNSRANQLAHHLKQLGVKPGVLVAVYLERSLEMIPALLGILKAGGAYVPLEPNFPKARIQLLLSSLKINCLVTQTSLLPIIHELQQQLPTLQHLICPDLSEHSQFVKEQFGHQQVWTRSDLEQLPIANLQESASSDDIAYVIFTSGSTGTPKGVVVRHQPVINLIQWVNKTFNVNSSDRVLFITSLCFDLSVYDIFGLLAAGGSIRIVSSNDIRDPETLLHILCHEPITFWDSAPPALQQLASFFPTVKSSDRHPQLRLVFLSGDWIPVKLPDLVKTTFPGVEVISLGGATEATVWSNYYPIGEVDPHWVSIPYGKPIQNAQYYILDSYLNPCPIDVSGELHIGGGCLASGYLNQPDLTAQKFIPNPFSDNPEARLYKTGDLARYLPDGNIEFLGRIDHQVKIRGFRIELGEIESVLAQHDSVQETVVIAREDQPGDQRLVAYVVNQQPAPAMNELRRFLQEKLPEYMVPSAFVAIDYIPLTPNGKVDRRALPIPDQVRPNLEKAFVAPSNAVEIQLTQI